MGEIYVICHRLEDCWEEGLGLLRNKIGRSMEIFL